MALAIRDRYHESGTARRRAKRITRDRPAGHDVVGGEVAADIERATGPFDVVGPVARESIGPICIDAEQQVIRRIPEAKQAYLAVNTLRPQRQQPGRIVDIVHGPDQALGLYQLGGLDDA